MLSYIFKRILLFVPTLLLISIITFIISQETPGDPVEMMMGRQSGSLPVGMISTQDFNKAYKQKRSEMGLDLPLFYFSVSTLATPDSLHKIPFKNQRNTSKRLIAQYGNQEAIILFQNEIRNFDQKLYAISTDEERLIESLINLNALNYRLAISYREEEIEEIIFNIKEEISRERILNMYLSVPAETLSQSFQTLKNNKTIWKNYIPVIHFYGLQNQYHRYFFGLNGSRGFISGNFGTSYRSKRPVANEIREAIFITLRLSMLAILITYIIAIPLGVWSAVKKGSFTDHTITIFLFILYSLPAFWVGTLLIIFFGGGDWLAWFPAYGLGEHEEHLTVFGNFLNQLYHLILPLIVIIIPSLAFLSRQIRGSMLQVLNQEYIKTARAKGLPSSKIVWKHTFRNSLLPVITLFASIFPFAIAGAVVAEVIFAIPGMGKLSLDAIYARNYPVVYAVVILSAIMTMIGMLIADILYALADPRIKYLKK